MSDAINLACVKCTSVLERDDLRRVWRWISVSRGGLWLDGERSRAPRVCPKKSSNRLRGLLSPSDGAPPPDSSHPIPCPACEGNLAEAVLGNVHVGYCGSCHGVFLDAASWKKPSTAVRGRDATTPRARS